MKPHKIFKLSNLAFIALISLSLFSNTSIANDDGKQGNCDMKKGPHKLMEAINITENQKDEFLAIMKVQHEKRQSIHKQGRESREQNHVAMKALHAETVEKLQPVLSEDQLELFEAFIKSNRPQKRAKGQGQRSSQQY